MKGELLELQCCGVREYYGINDGISADDMLLDIIIARKIDGEGFCQVIFNVVTSGTSTDENPFDDDGPSDAYAHDLPALVKLIAAEDLGTMFVSAAKRNPNSGNYLKTCVFTPNFGKMQAFFQDSDRYKERNGRHSHWTRDRDIFELRF